MVWAMGRGPEKMTGDFNIAPADVAREQGGE